MGVDAEMVAVHTSVRLTPKAVRSLAVRLAEAFGPRRFMIMEAGYGGPRHALNIVEEYEQDGPTLHPKSGEQFIAVSLYSRYYGEGYERGDLPFLLGVARWLRDAIPGCVVLYGGDSSGVLAKPLTPKAEAALWAHFVKHGHHPYTSGFSLGDDGIRTPHCDFCDVTMTRYLWGGKGRTAQAGYECYGCAKVLRTEDGGATWRGPTDEERRMRA